MFWYSVAMVVDFVLDLFSVRANSPDKDLEILLLRQQVRVLERKRGHKPRMSRWEKCLLAMLLTQLRHKSRYTLSQLEERLLFRPRTIMNWHPAMVSRKWTFKGGRSI